MKRPIVMTATMVRPGVLLALLVFSRGALAEPPPECQGREESEAFEAGRRAGRQTRPPLLLRDRRAACAYVGHVAGMLEEVPVGVAKNAAQCCEEGEQSAQIIGQLYCDLSIAFGGLDVMGFIPRTPQATCGASFEACCDEHFTSFTRDYGNLKKGMCRPYTEGEFSGVWAEARNNFCGYPGAMFMEAEEPEKQGAEPTQ
ncbi:hypothetical protein [Polyangium mundeleinium]|uniref:Uncharacterized protein n=1 Tax=Polyangium mundeleinium TaxID=2995306 RepID=A0ABT5F0I7_9BACT|nr:hypothetical protein [Polyangium mundeleinium]MDC0747589.1 hypothetical protein [Polyangium mundeleinium]